jgi:hypothetical protein
MDLSLGLYFLIGIFLAFAIRAFFRVLEAGAQEKQVREQEVARQRKVAALYGKSFDEEE